MRDPIFYAHAYESHPKLNIRTEIVLSLDGRHCPGSNQRNTGEGAVR